MYEYRFVNTTDLGKLKADVERNAKDGYRVVLQDLSISDAGFRHYLVCMERAQAEGSKP